MESEKPEILYSEAVFCDICDKLFEINSKCSRFKALSYDEFSRFNHKKIIIKNPYINKINNIIDNLINEYDKKYDFYVKKYIFKLVINNRQHAVKIGTNLHHNNIIMYMKYLLKDSINVIKDTLSIV